MPSTTFTESWELFGDFADATQRFTSGATPFSLLLSQMLAGPALTLPAATTVTVWDSASAALTSFDFLYLAAEAANIDIELTCTSNSGTRTFVVRLLADGFPLVLNDDTANFGFSDTNIGLISLIRARALDTNTNDARLRYAVGRA